VNTEQQDFFQMNCKQQARNISDMSGHNKLQPAVRLFWSFREIESDPREKEFERKKKSFE
jgi:hypothetical protein